MLNALLNAMPGASPGYAMEVGMKYIDIIVSQVLWHRLLRKSTLGGVDLYCVAIGYQGLKKEAYVGEALLYKEEYDKLKAKQSLDIRVYIP